ncbi:hypothetical protein PF005_g19851 [Phytophthora fragariae]|uniref:Secreted protein n=1 Tax=Phytophthora fragariae TaxID=53985 RepID=A0A6A3FYG0_9STRA|nr:hypothetical protein PF009_g545 [Phytophthora fragariae]KAE9093601.1 hypothetical protein PF010_g17418 [Phytophthora fragariae]KAE9116099.1 hypothetical protein PF007_g9786 [Phytophthora fragariae]KAE9188942.1 hypothetical protein PF005_g19851 [Phytophthora fragariae]KAE9252408.1 hypothetical protein PF002_g3835 [Phytophthora fragariae]
MPCVSYHLITSSFLLLLTAERRCLGGFHPGPVILVLPFGILTCAGGWPQITCGTSITTSRWGNRAVRIKSTDWLPIITKTTL